jgi:2-dehydro-3-deoxyphosphooctonate aldolase (KDO 8-P synthase)
MGLKAALPIFAEIRETLGLPVITDVHESSQCGRVAQAVDALQIPAFLCRQTDLLIAAAETRRPVNVKKGQFLAPWDMKNVVAKLDAAGLADILVTERGKFRLQHAGLRYARAAISSARPARRSSSTPPIPCNSQGTASGGERAFVGCWRGRRWRRRLRRLHRDPSRPDQCA